MGKASLLIDEPPLQVLPSLAALIGLNEAIFLQQLHYWLVMVRRSHNPGDGAKASPLGKIDREGNAWTFNTLPQWQEKNFPFWSIPTLKRVISHLKKLGLVHIARLNKSNLDQTRWYRIDYYRLDEILENGPVNEDLQQPEEASPSDQNDPMEATEEINLTLPLDQNDPIHEIKMTLPLDQNDSLLIKNSETTSEIPSEIPIRDANRPPVPKPNPLEVWKMIAFQLRMEMTTAAYQDFVSGLQPDGYSNGVYQLRAGSEKVRAWVDSRLGVRISRLLEVTYGQPVTLSIGLAT